MKKASQGLKHFVVGIWNRPRTLGVFLSVVVLIAFAAVLLDNQRKNRQAIEKGCILLNNAIIKSSTAGSNAASRVLVKEILRNAEQHGRFYVTAGYERAIAQQGQTFIALIPCGKVAHDPESITAIKLPPPAAPVPVRIPPEKK